MSYTRWHTAWLDLPTETTPANAGFLQHVEDTFVSQDGRITTLEASGGGGTGAVTSVAGRTGVVTLAKADVGLNNVDNTSDVNKPVSTLQTTAINTGDALAIPKSLVTAKGNLIVATASGTPTNLAVGADTQVLTADSTQATGTKWATPSVDIPQSLITAKGDLIVGLSSASPNRLPVGANGTILTADSTSGSGVKWGTAPILQSIMTTQGDLIVGNGSGVPTRLASSLSDGQVLTLNSGATNGLDWESIPSALNTVQDEGFAITSRSIMNFIGPAIKAVDNSGSTRTDVTVAELATIAPDHGLVGWTFPTYICGSTQQPTSGTVYLAKIKIPFGMTITKILWHVSTSAASPVSAENEVGIYSSTGSKQASLNVDTASTSTAQTLITSTISSITVNPPFIWIGFVFNAATPVGLGRSNSAFTAVFNAGLTASTFDFATNATIQTVLPSSLTLTSNIAGPAIWAAIAA